MTTLRISNDGISPELDPKILDVIAQVDHTGAYYLYDEQYIVDQIAVFKQREMAWGFQLRYAMKANPIKRILETMNKNDVHIDACSEYEVWRAMDAGFEPHQIQLTGQVLPENLGKLLELWISICACSLHQIAMIWKIKPGATMWIRLNPWSGSGQFPGVNVWGENSSFGIWYDKIPEILALAQEYDLRITTMHTHIGSGTNPDVREDVASHSLWFSKHFKDLETINLWWWFKIARTLHEKAVDISEVWKKLQEALALHEKNTGISLKLEVEPGSNLVANAGYLVAQIDDLVDTGASWNTFVKLNIGMSDIIRPIMYGAEHPIRFLTTDPDDTQQEVIIVGHSCESSDMLTVDNIWTPRKRKVPSNIDIWDLVIIGGAWAYCSSMNTKNYNSFPEIPEYLHTTHWMIDLIKAGQEVEDIWALEV